MSRGTRCDRPEPARVRQRDVVPWKSSGASLPARARVDELVVRAEERVEVERPGVLDVRDDERPRAVRALRRRSRGPRLTCSSRDAASGWPSTLGEGGVQARHLAHRAHERERDEVRVRGLAAAGDGEVPVQDVAVLFEDLEPRASAPKSRSGSRGSPPCSARCGRRRRGSARCAKTGRRPPFLPCAEDGGGGGSRRRGGDGFGPARRLGPDRSRAALPHRLRPVARSSPASRLRPLPGPSSSVRTARRRRARSLRTRP